MSRAARTAYSGFSLRGAAWSRRPHQLARANAGRAAPRLEFQESWLRLGAGRDGESAALAKATATGQVRKVGHQAGNGGQALFLEIAGKARHAAQEATRVRMVS